MRQTSRRGHPWLPLLIGAALALWPSVSSAHPGPQAAPGEPAVADTGNIPTGKFALRYRIEGTGTPAIVIGFPTYSGRVFSQNLRSHLRLVFVDHRGSAPSPGPVNTKEFALETLVDDIELVRRTLRLGRIAVIGHSGHSFMALEYAKKYPDHVSHVVMIGTSPDYSAASTEAAQQYWRDSVSPKRKAVLEDNLRRFPDEDLAKLPPNQQFIRSYVRDGPRIRYDSRFDSSPLWEGVEMNTDMFDYVWGVVFRDIDITKGLDTFDRPVLLLSVATTSWSRRRSPGIPSGGSSRISPYACSSKAVIRLSMRNLPCSMRSSFVG